MFNLLPAPVKVAHFLIKNKLIPGDVAVDATLGNGGDTLFLAELVGPEGRVYGFDIQEKAMEATSQKLHAEGYTERVTLFRAGHENLQERVVEKADVIMFNLGYLPGGDHSVITRPETTLQAIEQGLELLKAGGLMTIIVYPGHEGGAEEASLVEKFILQLPKSRFSCIKSKFMNRSEKSPYLITIEKAYSEKV